MTWFRYVAEWVWYGAWYMAALLVLRLPRRVIHGDAWLRQPFYWIVCQGWVFPNLPHPRERSATAPATEEQQN